MKTYKHYIIYKITNLVNNKIYIGKHKTDDLADKYFGSGKLLIYVINKYGIENFKFELLIDLKNQEEMDLLEELVVNKDFLLREDVYNISRGGKNPCMYGEDNPFYGKHHTEEVKIRLSKNQKGKKLSKEYCSNITTGLKRRFEDPNERQKCVTVAGKKKCINVISGEFKFYYPDLVPADFVIYERPIVDTYKTDEEKAESRRQLSERNKKSKWFNNGKEEKFCIPGTEPEGFVLGRLTGINVGRKYSLETIVKMSKSQTGVPSPNKGKILITNGIDNKYTDKNNPIPEGWIHGMTRHSKEQNAA